MGQFDEILAKGNEEMLKVERSKRMQNLAATLLAAHWADFSHQTIDEARAKVRQAFAAAELIEAEAEARFNS
jgi:hypothetical protein